MQKSFKEKKPTLYIVSTPIGNLSDITYRAVEILSSVHLILCEDTRTSAVLLAHYNIKKPLMSYHEFNKHEQKDKILSLLEQGYDLALISDAGTPGINDPGYEIIVDVINAHYHVVSIPGASAILASLVVSGLVIQPFTFIGFLPRKKSDYTRILKNYIQRHETLVIYESPNRVSKTLEELLNILGNRKIALCRELTKTYETIIRTSLLEAQTIEMNDKGEYVIIIEGNTEEEKPTLDILSHYQMLLRVGYTDKEALKEVAMKHQIPKSDVYRIVKIENKNA